MTPLERIVLARAQEQCDQENMKAPKCERCGDPLRGSRSRGYRVCKPCEEKEK